jgi:ribosomal protein S18 acetylase RimI-like enzyme
MRDHDIVAADALPAAQLHQAFGEAFADYLLGPFTMPLDAWPQFLGRQGIDLAQSKVALRTGAPVAFALVAPRPHTRRWRLGTTGALPSARGSGIARWLLDDFVARAAAAGQRGVELECFAQNERALRLYASRGFAEVSPLYGYTRAAATPLPPVHGDPSREVGRAEAFDWLDAQADADLPLQVTPVSLRALPLDLRAQRLGDALLVYSQAPAQLTFDSLVDRSPRQHDATGLVSALLHAHPGCSFHVPQLQRPDWGGEALELLGFQRLPLHQVYLRRDGLTPPP